MSLIKTWAPHFQSNVRMRGRQYQRAGRVRRLAPREGELVRAEVTGARTYTVVIRGEGSSASVECTCPYFSGGTYCKHIWATILDVQNNPVSLGAQDPDASAQAMNGADLRPPKARRRGSAKAARSKPAEPEWIGRLSLLRTAPDAPLRYDRAKQEPAGPLIIPTARQVLYTLEEDTHTWGGGLVVHLRQRQPTQSGWGRPKRLRISHERIVELGEPLDRELVAMLLGGGWAQGAYMSPWLDYEERDAFRLHAGMRRMVLRRLTESGRCFLEGGSMEQPLEWDGDEPWVLWLAGRWRGEELVTTLELRRGTARMPLREPAILVPGYDGVMLYGQKLAAFDDRGGTQWVRQVRGEQLRRGKEWSITVPEADVVRFLKRLYTMPSLPEVDLPEDVGRRELHVAPVPHLEVYSSDSPDAAVAVSVPRTQVLARLSFDYADVRVRPGDPGRFLAAEHEAEAKRADEASGREGGAEARADEPATGAADAADDDEETPDGHDGAADDAPAAEGNGSPAPPLAGGINLIRRDEEAERSAFNTLARLGFRHHPGNGGDALLLPVKLLPQAVAELLQRGWSVMADQRVIRRGSPPRLTISSGIDWFELHGGVEFQTREGVQRVALPELLAAARAGRTMLKLDDGSEGLVPQEWLERHGLLAAVGKAHGDHLRFQLTQAALLDALLDAQDLASVDAQFEAARERLAHFQGIQPIDPAPTFQGQLRPYQREGLGWMAFLRWFGMGGVLADDMGLGKTIQVLAMLDARYGERVLPNQRGEERSDEGTELRSDEVSPSLSDTPSPAHKPTLVVAPRSVVFNWIDEARHFAPRLRVQAYTGADRATLRESFADHDAIVTSYGLMRRDIEQLMEHEFDYVVLDEAQAIKNASSQSAKAARLLRADHRLALTGTPVENHLGDLWSIFEFLNPGMLGSNTGFGRMVREETPGERRSAPAAAEPAAAKASFDAGAAVRIAQALRPFILRRTKRQVLADLPEKTEQTILCQLEPEQAELYNQLREHYRQSLLGGKVTIGEGAAAGQTMMVLEALLRLRQAACHPGLIDPKRADEPSAKLEALLDRVSDLIEEGHKALVFSQFTSLLTLVRKRLDDRGVVYEYLDGQTRDRRERVHRFQSDPACPLFLISLRAGGLGLNLTAAEYVFILDPWWNPAVEAQAIDRTHRIGQTRHVFAYRLICQDTVEQRIAELQAKKKQLADAIIGGQENLLRQLTREDLEQLLS